MDMNRRWLTVDQHSCPEVYCVKQVLADIVQKKEVLFFIDLHGHSQKKRSFVYGCNEVEEGGTTQWTKARLLPKILARLTTFFNIDDCRFRITEDKLSTARYSAGYRLTLLCFLTLLQMMGARTHCHALSCTGGMGFVTPLTGRGSLFSCGRTAKLSTAAGSQASWLSLG